MAHTDRRKAWGRCPEPDCDYCVQGKAKTPFIRYQRRRVRQIIHKGAWWLI